MFSPLLLPAWFPSDEILVAVVVLLAGLVILNRNFRWLVERIDVLPAVVLAAGVFFLVGSDWVMATVTSSVGTQVWFGLGVAAMVVGALWIANDFRD